MQTDAHKPVKNIGAMPVEARIHTGKVMYITYIDVGPGSTNFAHWI